MQVVRQILCGVFLLPLVCYAQQCIRRYTSEGADCRTLSNAACRLQGSTFFGSFGGIGLNNQIFFPQNKLVSDFN